MPHQNNDTLIIINMQEGFRCAELLSIVEPVRELMQYWRGEVIHMKFFQEPGSIFEQRLDWTMFQNKADRETMKELKNMKVQELWHNTYSIITPELQAILESKKDQKIFVAGVFTDVCITHFSVQCFDAEMHIQVVEDACATPHGEEANRSSISSLAHMIGSHGITDVREALMGVNPEDPYHVPIVNFGDKVL